MNPRAAIFMRRVNRIVAALAVPANLAAAAYLVLSVLAQVPVPSWAAFSAITALIAMSCRAAAVALGEPADV